MKFRTDANSQNVVPITPPVENKEYLHTTAAGVLVPLWQTAITGLLVFTGAWLIAWLVFDLVDPIKPAVVICVLVTIGVWIWRLWQWANLTNRIEKLTNTDLNGDGKIGGKEPETIRINLNRVSDGKNGPSWSQSSMDLPLSKEQLVTLARGMNGGMPFSERVWAGPGKPFSSNEFRMLRNIMIRRGLIRLISEKDPRQGFELTEEGWSVMEYFDPPEEVDEEEEI